MKPFITDSNQLHKYYWCFKMKVKLYFGNSQSIMQIKKQVRQKLNDLRWKELILLRGLWFEYRYCPERNLAMYRSTVCLHLGGWPGRGRNHVETSIQLSALDEKPSLRADFSGLVHNEEVEILYIVLLIELWRHVQVWGFILLFTSRFRK